MDIEKLVRENPKLFFWGLLIAVVLLLVCWMHSCRGAEGFGGAGGLQTLSEQGYFQGSGHEGYSARRLEGVEGAEEAPVNAADLAASTAFKAAMNAADASGMSPSAALKAANAARSAAFQAALNANSEASHARAVITGDKISNALAVHNAQDLRAALGCKAGSDLGKVLGQYIDMSNNGQSWVARSDGTTVQSEGMANLDRKLAASMNGL